VPRVLVAGVLLTLGHIACVGTGATNRGLSASAGTDDVNFESTNGQDLGHHRGAGASRARAGARTISEAPRMRPVV
jgi:hypothetical protein